VIRGVCLGLGLVALAAFGALVAIERYQALTDQAAPPDAVFIGLGALVLAGLAAQPCWWWARRRAAAAGLRYRSRSDQVQVTVAVVVAVVPVLFALPHDPGPGQPAVSALQWGVCGAALLFAVPSALVALVRGMLRSIWQALNAVAEWWAEPARAPDR
jgi:hypothetical protein